ncbi:hypothetical protein ACVWZW_004484 [Bradyrhizobium sp. F1.13.4]
MSSAAAHPLRTETTPVGQNQSDQELDSVGKFAVWWAIASVLFFNQIAYNIGDFPVASDLICYAFFTAFLVVSRHAAVSMPTLYLLTCTIALSLLRIPFSSSQSSLSSLLLLVAGYSPFIFRLQRRPDIGYVHDYILKAYVTAATVIAAVAVVQIVLVNITKLDVLTNIYFILPKDIRGAGAYTFLREEGGIVKANGFFLRESGELSADNRSGPSDRVPSAEKTWRYDRPFDGLADITFWIWPDRVGCRPVAAKIHQPNSSLRRFYMWRVPAALHALQPRTARPGSLVWSPLGVHHSQHQRLRQICGPVGDDQNRL